MYDMPEPQEPGHWQRITSTRLGQGQVKSEKTRPDLRFSPLDWHDFIEVSDQYPEAEKKIVEFCLHQMAGDSPAIRQEKEARGEACEEGIPEFRYMLRLAHEPVASYQLPPLDMETANPRSSVEKYGKLLFLPHPRKPLGDMISRTADWYTSSAQPESTQFVNATGEEEYVFIEPLASAGLKHKSKDGSYYEPSVQSAIIHELSHKISTAMPLQVAMKDLYYLSEHMVLNKKAQETLLIHPKEKTARMLKLRQKARTGNWQDKLYAWIENLRPYRRSEGFKKAMEEIKLSDNDVYYVKHHLRNDMNAWIEKLPISLTNQIMHRYYGEEIRDLDYSAPAQRTVKKPKLEDIFFHKEVVHPSRIGMWVSDPAEKEWNLLFTTLMELKKTDPVEHNIAAYRFTHDLRNNWADLINGKEPPKPSYRPLR